MYFAVRQDINKTETYQHFLCDILATNNKHYISIFSDVIEQSQKLIATNDFYSINSERIGIISFFAQYQDIIGEMNPNNLQKEDFEKLLKCFDLECHC